MYLVPPTPPCPFQIVILSFTVKLVPLLRLVLKNFPIKGGGGRGQAKFFIKIKDADKNFIKRVNNFS